MTNTTNSGRRGCVALVLQGGGALGAYQAGVYEALHKARQKADWVAGTSIGAINAALIAGNPPEIRVERLREFWDLVSSSLPLVSDLDDTTRLIFRYISSAATLTLGVPGFFYPRFSPPWLQPEGSLQALSFYSTTPLRQTLERLVDFDRINNGAVRLSVGAVNIQTGNLECFDNTKIRIGPEHIMASGALPPGLPPITIDGKAYWDGGLVSNSPLQYVLDEEREADLLAFQIDLFSARGPMPRNVVESAERVKDIRYSSRTRLNTDVARERRQVGRALHRLLDKLPIDLHDDPDAQFLRKHASKQSLTIVHLIYRAKHVEGFSKDYEFSRLSIERHWQSGLQDGKQALGHSTWVVPPAPGNGVRIFDLRHCDADSNPARKDATR